MKQYLYILIITCLLAACAGPQVPEQYAQSKASPRIYPDLSFQTKYFVQKELDIRGSRNAQPSDFRAVIHYLERGTCPTDDLITKVIKPEEALDTMHWWSQNPGKVFRILVDFES